MASEIILPKLGNSVEECLIKLWNKEIGDEVQVDEVICEVETDKTSAEVLSTEAGILLHKFYEVDEVVPILKVIAIVGSTDENIEQLIEAHSTKSEVKKDKKEVPQDSQTQRVSDTREAQHKDDVRGTSHIAKDNTHQPTPVNTHIAASPRARSYLESIGLTINLFTRHFALPDEFFSKEFLEEEDVRHYFSRVRISPAAIQTLISQGKFLSLIRGSGVAGRIIEQDIEGLGSVGETQTANREKPSLHKTESLASLGYGNLELLSEKPLSRIRKIIADRMHHSLQSSAQLSLFTKVAAKNIKAARASFKKESKAISINDIILFCVSRVLEKLSWANSLLIHDTLYSFSQVNLGFAVQTEQGLMVPNVNDATRKSIEEIAKETKELSNQCKKGTISPELLKGGTFTCTNLGVWGIQGFTPVLNAPQTAILGIGEIELRVIEVEQNKFDFEPCINLSLTFDHRAYDGADAADLLVAFSKSIEQFSID